MPVEGGGDDQPDRADEFDPWRRTANSSISKEATFGLGYAVEGPLYIYKADPKTLQPAGATDFINTGLEYGNPPVINGAVPVAAGSYVFVGCANAQTGSEIRFCATLYPTVFDLPNQEPGAAAGDVAIAGSFARSSISCRRPRPIIEYRDSLQASKRFQGRSAGPPCLQPSTEGLRIVDGRQHA